MGDGLIGTGTVGRMDEAQAALRAEGASLSEWVDQRIAEREDERFLVATVSRDGRVIGLDHPTEADWNEVRAAHVALRDHLNERLANEERCPHRPADAP